MEEITWNDGDVVVMKNDEEKLKIICECYRI